MKTHFSPFWIRSQQFGPSLITTVISLFLTVTAQAKLNVVATLPDFGAIAQAIGGDWVKVSTIAKGTEDPHFVDAKPSFARLLNQADLLLEGGAELEIGWLPPLVNTARNPKILTDAPGHLVMSQGIALLEVPTGPVDRSQGDVHPLGNPHYWLDPANGSIMATTIATALKKLDPAHAGSYDENLARFKKRLDDKLADWTQQLAPLRGTKLITYHKSYEYLLHRFGFELVDTIEPKPGIEPSPTHINALIPRAKAANVKLILIEPCRPHKTPEHLAHAIGARLVVLPAQVGGEESIHDYFELFDAIVLRLKQATSSAP